MVIETKGLSDARAREGVSETNFRAALKRWREAAEGAAQEEAAPFVLLNKPADKSLSDLTGSAEEAAAIRRDAAGIGSTQAES